MQQRLQEELYWKERWAANRTGWHMSAPHSTLVEYIDLVAPRRMPETEPQAAPSVVFLPLCGKTLDIHWLRDEGYSVIGCEVSEDALVQLFNELDEKPQIYMETTSLGTEVRVLETRAIKIYNCNIFDLGNINVTATYDRAALVALPGDTRERYARHLIQITGGAPQLLIAFEHQRDKCPPYSVPLNLVRQYYGDVYDVESLSHRAAYDGLIEISYLLTRK